MKTHNKKQKIKQYKVKMRARKKNKTTQIIRTMVYTYFKPMDIFIGFILFDTRDVKSRLDHFSGPCPSRGSLILFEQIEFLSEFLVRTRLKTKFF